MLGMGGRAANTRRSRIRLRRAVIGAVDQRGTQACESNLVLIVHATKMVGVTPMVWLTQSCWRCKRGARGMRLCARRSVHFEKPTSAHGKTQRHATVMALDIRLIPAGVSARMRPRPNTARHVSWCTGRICLGRQSTRPVLTLSPTGFCGLLCGVTWA